MTRKDIIFAQQYKLGQKQPRQAQGQYSHLRAMPYPQRQLPPSVPDQANTGTANATLTPINTRYQREW